MTLKQRKTDLVKYNRKRKFHHDS